MSLEPEPHLNVLEPHDANTTSALLSLPNELLAAVVAAGQEGRIPDRSESEPDFTLKSEWTLSHVSRRFRAVLTNAPELWTLVELQLCSAGSVEVFKLYLERSQMCKIWATICEISQDGVDNRLMAERLAHIAAHARRLWRLDIVASAPSINVIVVAFRHAAAPFLKHLEIVSIHKDADYEGFFPGLHVFNSEPPRALTVLKTVGFALQFSLPQWTAPLMHLEVRGNLVRQEFLGDAPRFVAAAARYCRALTHLYIDTTMAFGARTMSRIIFPSLISLRINVQSDDPFPALRILRFFDVPALTRLTIHCNHGDAIWAFSNVFPQIVFPSLTSLFFIANHCSCRGLAPSFLGATRLNQCFPAVSSLTLVNQCYTVNMIAYVLDIVSQPWPLLDAITVCPTERTLQDVYATLQDVIRSKRASAQPIPRFRFSPMLLEQPYWAANGIDVEFFDPADVLDNLD